MQIHTIDNMSSPCSPLVKSQSKVCQIAFKNKAKIEAIFCDDHWKMPKREILYILIIMASMEPRQSQDLSNI